MPTADELAAIDSGGNQGLLNTIFGETVYVGTPDIPGTIINPDALTAVGAPGAGVVTPPSGQVGDALSGQYQPGVITPQQPVPPVIEPGVGPKPSIPTPTIEPPFTPNPPVPYRPPPVDIPGGGGYAPPGGFLWPFIYGIFTEDFPTKGIGSGVLDPNELYPINPVTMPQPLPQPGPSVWGQVRQLPPIYPEPVDTGGARRVTAPDLFPPGARPMPEPGYYDLQPIQVDARRIRGFDYGSVMQPFPAPPSTPKKSRRQRVRQAAKAIVSGQLSNVWPFVGALGGLIGGIGAFRGGGITVSSSPGLTPVSTPTVESPTPTPEPTPTPAPTPAPVPQLAYAGGTFGTAGGGQCDCSQCRSRKKKPRKCLARAPLRWAGGPKKGKPAGTRCIRFAN